MTTETLDQKLRLQAAIALEKRITEVFEPVRQLLNTYVADDYIGRRMQFKRLDGEQVSGFAILAEMKAACIKEMTPREEEQAVEAFLGRFEEFQAQSGALGVKVDV